MAEGDKSITAFPQATGRDVVKDPTEGAAVLNRGELGLGKMSIAREPGVSKTLVLGGLEGNNAGRLELALDAAAPSRPAASST